MDECFFCKSSARFIDGRVDQPNQASTNQGVECPECSYYEVSERVRQFCIPKLDEEDKKKIALYLKNLPAKDYDPKISLTMDDIRWITKKSSW